MDSDDTNKAMSSQDLNENRVGPGGRAAYRGHGQKGVVATALSVIGMKESDDMKLEDEINLSHLMKLMETFHEADENGSDGLDIDEFRNAFGEILGKGKNDQQMNIMFMKIDTNCDGTVDWDEFCTYMLLEYQEKDGMGCSDKEKPFSSQPCVVHCPHHDSSICWLQSTRRLCDGPLSDEQKVKDGRYVMVSKEGTACFWNREMVAQKSLTLDYPKPKKMWVTDCVALSNVNKLAIATTDNDICFYDLAAGLCEIQYHISALPNAIQCMDYWFDPLKPNRSILTFGGMGGNVGAFLFHRATMGLFAAKKQDHCLRIHFVEVLTGQRSDLCTAILVEKVHSDWSKKVKYCRALDSFISCSCDPQAALVLSHMYDSNDRTKFKISKGVNSFDYSEEWNSIVTGGIDRVIRIWSPHVVSKPTGVMKGHNAAITHIIVCNKNAHIYSLSKDKVFKVWDLRHQSCVQTISRLQSLGPAPITGVFFCEYTHTLLMLASQIGVLEATSCDLNDGHITSHEKPIRAALYNENFNQVVSGCSDSVVCVWDLETGEKVIHFSRVHGDCEITAMVFDPTGRRLITGGRDGTIKIWNFNNGACLGELTSPDTCEITSITCPPGRICTAGWSRRVVVHSDVRDSEERLAPRIWQTIHNEDILCMSFCPPNLAATGSYDGDILIWSLDMETVYCHLSAKRSCKTIMRGPVSKKGGLTSIVRKRSFIETHTRPNEVSPSGLELIFREKRASRKYSLPTDLLYMKKDVGLPRIRGKNPLPAYAELEESNDISSLAESAVTVSHCRKRHNEQDLSASLSTDLEQVECQEDKPEFLNKSDLNYSSSETSSFLQQNNDAVEQVVFLEAREHDMNSALVVSAGSGGWVRFWNIYGDGLRGEFLALHHGYPEFSSVLAIATDPGNVLLFTGCTEGYIKIWDISGYCIGASARRRNSHSPHGQVHFQLLEYNTADSYSRRLLDSIVAEPKLKTPKFKRPPLLSSWRCHLKSITSLSYINNKELVLTASTDCTVRLWSVYGRYIGTFGQRNAWQLPNVSELSTTSCPVPMDINPVASVSTLKTLSHSKASSHRRLTKNVLHAGESMRLGKKYNQDGLCGDAQLSGGDGSSTSQLCEERAENDEKHEMLMESQSRRALDKAYKRTRRVKKPHQLPKLRHDKCSSGLIYPALQYAELEDVTKFKRLPRVKLTDGISGLTLDQRLSLPRQNDGNQIARTKLRAVVKAMALGTALTAKSKVKFNENNLFGTTAAKEGK